MMKTISVLVLATLFCCILAQTPPSIVPSIALTTTTHSSTDCSGTGSITSPTTTSCVTGTGSSYNFVALTNTVKNCTYTSDNCAGTGNCATVYSYGVCQTFGTGSINITWQINAQQLATITTPVNITFAEYDSSAGCTIDASSTVIFTANQCFQGSSSTSNSYNSYAYNIVSDSELSACNYASSDCSGQGICQSFDNAACTQDAGANGYVLKWTYNGSASTTFVSVFVAFIVLFNLL